MCKRITIGNTGDGEQVPTSGISAGETHSALFGNSSDDESVSGALDSGLILSRVKPITLKLVFTACLKLLSRISPSWIGRQVAGNS